MTAIKKKETNNFFLPKILSNNKKRKKKKPPQPNCCCCQQLIAACYGPVIHSTRYPTSTHLRSVMFFYFFFFENETKKCFIYSRRLSTAVFLFCMNKTPLSKTKSAGGFLSPTKITSRHPSMNPPLSSSPLHPIPLIEEGHKTMWRREIVMQPSSLGYYAQKPWLIIADVTMTINQTKLCCAFHFHSLIHQIAILSFCD